MKSYDVIVIGSGGGSKITRPAANMGLKVAIIEKGKLGGTCLNHGCIPSKMLIHPAEMIDQMHDANRFQIDLPQNPTVRFKELVERVTATIEKDSNSIAPAYESHPNIDFYPYEARFVEPKVIEVNGEQLTANKIVIAAGCRANIPPIPGLEGTPYMTYKEALRNTTLPKKMTVIGGGFIALELGYFYGMMGCEVEFCLRSTLLRNEDEDIAEEFKNTFSKKFKIRENVTFNQVRHENNSFSLDIHHQGEDHTIDSDALLVATGVKPNSDLLNLTQVGFECDARGYVIHNDHLETNIPGVTVLGDIIGKHLFRHAANFEGEYVFFRHIQEGHQNPINYPAMPSAIFTHPQIAKTGASEKELIESGVPYYKGGSPYHKSAMGMALLSDHGFVKLLFHKETHKLIGAQIIGHEAATMIHMPMAYLHMGGTLNDMLSIIYIHPALPELVRNAARNAAINFNKAQ